MITKFIFNAVDTLDPEGTTSISVTDDDSDQILFLSNPKNCIILRIYPLINLRSVYIEFCHLF